MTRLTLFVFLSLALTGCDRSDEPVEIMFLPRTITETNLPEGINFQINAILGSDPIKDASDAFHAGDFRLVGVSGFVLRYPGTPTNGFTEAYANSNGVKVVAGTREVINTKAQERLDDAAIKYASAYNRQLLLQGTNKTGISGTTVK